jgi:ATP-dependent RNA helicase DDX3X
LFSKSNVGINFAKYDDIPVVTQGDDVPKPIDSFTDIDLGPVLKNNIGLAQFTSPTPVQKYAIPIILQGRDLMACAQTGSGKTGAFLFPIISQLATPARQKEPSRREVPPSYGSYRRSMKISPDALILAPTRELAIQIHKEANKFTYRSHLRSVVVYGGAEFRSQLLELEKGCNILVATPGRLLDMIERGKVSIKEIIYLCIDEADRMLDMGFEQQIRSVLDECSSIDRRQTLMFSATFPKSIQRLAEDFLNNYIFLRVGRIGSTTDFITQRIKWVDDCNKKAALIELLPTVQGLTLIFTETKRMADHLEEYLYCQGFSAASIHGDRTQKEREDALDAFRSGQAQILVATDVAARGLDVQDVKHVINYDLPNDIDDYVHRIGRTGRAGNEGIATAFFSDKNRNVSRELVDLLEEAGQEVESWLWEVASASNSSRGRQKRSKGGRSYNNRSYGNRGYGGGGYSSYSGGSSYGNYNSSGIGYSYSGGSGNHSSNDGDTWW